MANVVEAVKDVISRKEERGKAFNEQLERHRKFKERMRAAGVEYGDKFTIPLMTRLGHLTKAK